MVLNDLQGRRTGVTRVRAQVLTSSLGRVGSFDHHAVEYRTELRDVMAIRSGHDERQRDATTVHQQMALAPIFSPDPLGWAQRFPVPWALSSWRRQCFAIAMQCLRARHIRQGPASKDSQIHLRSPIQESGHVSHWHCRTVQRAVLSTGTPCAKHKRLPRIRGVGLWACGLRQPCACSSDFPGAGAAGSMSVHVARIHLSLPRIWPLSSSLQTRYSRLGDDYPLFTDRF